MAPCGPQSRSEALAAPVRHPHECGTGPRPRGTSSSSPQARPQEDACTVPRLRALGGGSHWRTPYLWKPLPTMVPGCGLWLLLPRAWLADTDPGRLWRDAATSLLIGGSPSLWGKSQGGGSRGDGYPSGPGPRGLLGGGQRTTCWAGPGQGVWAAFGGALSHPPTQSEKLQLTWACRGAAGAAETWRRAVRGGCRPNLGAGLLAVPKARAADG